MTHSKEVGSNRSEISSLDEGLYDSPLDPKLPVSARHDRSTRVSLLVEALVRSLVSVYETDRQKVLHTYKKICRRLFRMGLIDESWSMVELEGARMQFEHALFQLFCEGPTSSSTSNSLMLQDGYYSSQYKREFDEFERIGGGAFGKVFRVKHKLDSTEYAVKKIPIQSEAIEAIENYISEVKTFASLNHPNIVQYKAAWLELGPPSDSLKAIKSAPLWDKPEIVVTPGSNHDLLISEDISENSDTASDKDTSKDVMQKHPNWVVTDTNMFPFNNKLSASSLTYRRVNSNSNFEIEFENDSNSLAGCSSPKKESSPSTEKAIVLPYHTQNGAKKMSKAHWATLYIQMSLCHGTLQQWLRKRHESFDAEVAVMSSGAEALRTKAILQILIQLLRGLNYIHSKGIVHHDIKPSNIFVSTESGSLLVQLGDFGLACPLQQTRHGFARGTPLYAAPEQLAGRCDPKSDMFSLGIVLFELIEDFGTEMERTVRITQLRSRRDPPVPTDLTLPNLVSALVRHRSRERPDASTLLQALESDQAPSRPDVEALERSLREKDEEINRLRELLKKHGLSDDS